MGIQEAESAMAALERAECTFDYDKVGFYKSQVQKFVEQKNAQLPDYPALVDISQGRTELPASLIDRIEKWMLDHPTHSPFMRAFARNYLISLLDDDCDATLYSHLAACVIEGGDFYLESGMLYLRDAATVSTYVDHPLAPR